MRIVLAIVIALSAAACGKKQAPKAPAATQAAPDTGSAAPTESAAPGSAPDSSPQPTTKSDPEEGGQ
jgi:hypothetical protein